MHNRDRLLYQAALDMAEHGFHGFTMDTVLASTGIAKSNAYYHFASKEQLGLEVLRYWCDLFLQFEDAIFSTTQLGQQAKLSLLHHQYVTFQEASHFVGPIPSLLASQINSIEAQQCYDSFIMRRHAMYHQFLTAGKRSGEFFPHLNPRAISWLAIDLIIGASFEARIHHNTASLTRAFHQLSSLISVA